jgi:hypothetical protein
MFLLLQVVVVLQVETMLRAVVVLVRVGYLQVH